MSSSSVDDPSIVNARFLCFCVDACCVCVCVCVASYAFSLSSVLGHQLQYVCHLYTCILSNSDAKGDTAIIIRPGGCGRMANERAHSPIGHEFRLWTNNLETHAHTSATRLCSVNNNVMAIIWLSDLRKSPLIWCVLSRAVSMTASPVLLRSCQLPLSTSHSIFLRPMVTRLRYVCVCVFFTSSECGRTKKRIAKTKRYDRFRRV